NRRTLYGKTNSNLMSRFIDEIPEDLIREDEKKEKHIQVIPEKDYFKTNTYAWQVNRVHRKSQANKTVNDDIKTGSKVKHTTWGIGTVINISGEGEDAIASVAFPGTGIKKLSFDTAPIELVE